MRAFWLLAGIAWFLLLGIWSALPGGEPGIWSLLADARFSGWTSALLRDVLWMLAQATLPFVALGILCRLTFPGDGGLAGRMLAVPAGLAWAAGLALLVAGLGAGAKWRAPAAVEAFLPLLGSVVGVVLGGAFVLPLRRMLPSLIARVLLLGVAALLGAGLLAAALLGGAEPTAPTATITSEEKRALVDELRRQNPLGLEPGERTVVELGPERLQALLGWAVLLVDDAARAEVRAVGDAIAWQTSVRLPGRLGWRPRLTLSGELALASKEGALTIDRCVLAAGDLALAPWLCHSLLGSLHRAAMTSRDLGALAAALDWLTLDDAGLAARYGSPALDAQALQRLRLAFGPSRAVRAATAAQFDLLRAQAPDLAQSGDRFRAILQSAFELAERRSAFSDPVAENQGVILALATILGHPEIATLAGIERPADWQRSRDMIWPVSLRGRADWTRHFMVSAGLAQLSTAVVSDAAGLLKEELDAVRGSGFSFGDLLADRAGTRFGEIAVRSPASAVGLQAAMVRDWRTEHLMPSAEGLREGIDEATLQREYGGVGGARYRTVVADIEARVGRLPTFEGAGSR
jgi:hypothetical protein